MQWKNNHLALGLDIGQTAVKAVLLSRNVRKKDSSGLKIRYESFSLWEEGILDEGELYKSLGTWLQEKKLTGISTCVGLPQYLTTPQISDFPPGISGELLDKMVRDETAHLSGLSDEKFVYDYQVLPPAFGRNNPALIGICRETVVEERCSRLADIKVNVQDLAMSGLAMANAFFYLHLRERENSKLQLLIDLGTENSTLAIIAQGQVLYVSSLMFGAKRITKALAEELNCSEHEAELRKKTYQAAWGNPDCPLLPVVKQLERELDSALEHWRQSTTESGALPIVKIWLTGGGAQLWGLNAHLIRTYGCQVGLFGPPGPDHLPESENPTGSEISPEMTIAFGLALQGINAGEYQISLIPELLRWQQAKMARFKYLFWTAALLILILAAALAGAYFQIVREQKALEIRLNELNVCRNLVPKLDDRLAQIGHCQRMLVPLVEYGTRGWRFLATVDELQRAMVPKQSNRDGWCIYIADEFSYRKSAGIIGTKSGPTTASGTDSKGSGGIIRLQPRNVAAETSSSNAAEAEPIPVFKMELLQQMIVGGFSPRQPDKAKYEVPKDILDSLNAGQLFQGADWFSDWDEAHALKVFKPWQNLFEEISPRRGRKARDEDAADVDFRIKLPFKNSVVRPPPPPPPPVRRRR